jgi:hypothetical protein
MWSSPGRTAPAPHDTLVVRIYYESLDDIRLLSSYDLWEYNNTRERYVLAYADPGEYRRLRDSGFRVEIDADRTDELWLEPTVDKAQVTGIQGFPCYRTVEETYAAAQQIVDDHPTLAAWIDVGDSWEKSRGPGGYDMMVLRLTNSAVPGPKPPVFITSSVHAREYTPAELNTRFAEHLVDGYGFDADVTWLLDYHEIHLMLQANPDGRKMAETGVLWRKNTNEDYCGSTSSLRGADLNRNYPFEWACCGGSSSGECDETYRGPAAASEPETQAIAAYIVSLFPDRRAAPLDAPAPDDATGIYIDIHSQGRYVLWPWGFGGTAPNGTQLQTLGRKLAFFNAYTAQQAVVLYPTDGASDDFAYGELGVAAFTYELGTAHFQDCSSFEAAIYPGNLDSLLYASKVARSPYLTPAGPDAVDLGLTTVLVDVGGPTTLTARIDETRYSSISEPIQTIASAEYYVDVPPWDTAASPVAVPLEATDGLFDSVVEEVRADVDTTGLGLGRHSLFVRGQDANGNWGAVGAVFLWVLDGDAGGVVGTVRDAASAQPLAASITVERLGGRTTSDPLTGAFAMRLPSGSWTLTALAPGYLPQTLAGVSVNDGVDTPQDFTLVIAPPILVVDDDDDNPDVRAAYTDALDTLGESYYVWDTFNSDNEPDIDLISSFDAIVWFTGDEYGGAAGPGSQSELALATWLEGGNCLLMSSQDYSFDRDLTLFMRNYLGLHSFTEDVKQTSVTGQGSAFGGLGPFTLQFPYDNFTDDMVPDFSAEVAFDGSVGAAGLSVDAGSYRTSYWGFGLETLPTASDRQDTLGAFLSWCGGLTPVDRDEDGVADLQDCAPDDPTVWSSPLPASGLVLSTALTDNLRWSAPLEPGASIPTYDLLRSPEAAGFVGAGCIESGQTDLVATDAASPPPGGLYAYLVRVLNPCGNSLGRFSSGAPRVAPTCP